MGALGEDFRAASNAKLMDIIIQGLHQALSVCPQSSPRMSSAMDLLCNPQKTIKIDKYILRIIEYLSPHALSGTGSQYFTQLLIRIARAYGGIDALNAHKMLLVATLLSLKFLEDQAPANAYVAKVGGMHTETINALEIKTLDKIRWNICL